jgi:hypothetical protein
MDWTKDEKQIMGYREFYAHNSDEIRYIVKVAAVTGRATITRLEEMPWDDEHGTGPDEEAETFDMTLDDLKELIKQAQAVVNGAEAYRQAHPVLAPAPAPQEA